MQVNVKKWGNSASVRIPASVMAAAGIKVDQAVDIREEEGRIIIERLTKPKYNLAAMVASMTPGTFHEEIDFGPPVGEEIW